MNPSMTTGTLSDAQPRTTPAHAPISGPPTFARTSTGLEGSGLFISIDF